MVIIYRVCVCVLISHYLWENVCSLSHPLRKTTSASLALFGRAAVYVTLAGCLNYKICPHLIKQRCGKVRAFGPHRYHIDVLCALSTSGGRVIVGAAAVVVVMHALCIRRSNNAPRPRDRPRIISPCTLSPSSPRPPDKLKQMNHSGWVISSVCGRGVQQNYGSSSWSVRTHAHTHTSQNRLSSSSLTRVNSPEQRVRRR